MKLRGSILAPVALAFLILPFTACADIGGFGDFSQYTVNQSDGSAGPTISNGAIHLTTRSPFEDRSIFFNTPQSIGSFTASFTYQALNPITPGGGAAFVLENATAGPHAIGSGEFGATIIHPAAAVTLELQNSLNTANSSGFYTNGQVNGGSASVSPVNLVSGDPINVTIAYNGVALSETLLDAKTSATFSTAYITNLPNILGGTSAYIGFTAGTGLAGPSGGGVEQVFSNFTFIGGAVPEPGCLTLVAIAVGCVTLKRKR
jgi:hypothetical protein